MHIVITDVKIDQSILTINRLMVKLHGDIIFTLTQVKIHIIQQATCKVQSCSQPCSVSHAASAQKLVAHVFVQCVCGSQWYSSTTSPATLYYSMQYTYYCCCPAKVFATPVNISVTQVILSKLALFSNEVKHQSGTLQAN